MLYDTHCHLNYHTDEELNEIISRAKQYKVSNIIQAGANIRDIHREINICNDFTDTNIKIFCGIANHPENTKDNVVSIDKLIQLATISPYIKAIGETGLDTHIPEHEDFLSDQIKSFENHIAVAIETKKPIIVHARGEQAIRKSCEILQFYSKKNNIHFVMHSYTGDLPETKKILDIGGFISFSGIITFKNANNVREVAKIVPIKQMFVETDAPFLAPVPMRGKQNETGFVNFTAHFVSDFLNINYNEFCATTTNNAKTFFQHE